MCADDERDKVPGAVLRLVEPLVDDRVRRQDPELRLACRHRLRNVAGYLADSSRKPSPALGQVRPLQLGASSRGAPVTAPPLLPSSL